jgi:sulfite reductase alpha subunit-like flavoprotein
VQLLTSDACPHEKRVLHVVFDVSGSGMKFQAGDAFTVHPSNHPALVEALLKHLGEDGNRFDLKPLVFWHSKTTSFLAL